MPAVPFVGASARRCFELLLPCGGLATESKEQRAVFGHYAGRLAELEEFARRRGKSTADALDEVLAEYLEWERQDYQESLEAVRQGHEDVKPGRTVPADRVFDEFARKRGLPR
jgi:hypothetical protein